MTRTNDFNDVDIQKLLEKLAGNPARDPHSQAEPRLRTTLLYTNLTARAVYDALLQKGWSKATLPTVRTISNLLARHDYRLRTVAKTKVQKKRRTPTQSSKTSGE